MRRHIIPLMIVVIATMASGCTLEPVPELGAFCKNAEYYSDDMGNRVGSLTSPDDAYYRQYADYRHCPLDYPVCAKDEDNVAFCHQECPGSQIFCKEGCVDASQNKNYCGAKGFCTDVYVGSENYRGLVCPKAQVCSEGACICPDESQVLCGSSCITPESDLIYCGARGLCKDADPASKDYMGDTCPQVQKCLSGECKCPNNDDILCDDDCINPLENNKYCGATGLCTDDSVTSPNYKGDRCLNGYKCDNGKCRIDCQINFHEDGGSCAMDDIDNCGGVGIQCESYEVCSLGECAANCGGSEVKCNYNDKEVCVTPSLNPLFCGANSECEDYTVCDDTQDCVDSKCVCKPGYHLFTMDGIEECELNDDNNCGSHGNICQLRENVTQVACTEEGLCEAVACVTGYHVYEGDCEVNSNNHCGKHGAQCVPGVPRNSASVFCNIDAGVCEAVSCEEGYHVYQGQCEPDDINNCGANGRVCSKDNVTGSTEVSCVAGQCLATACDANHRLYNGVCLENTCSEGSTKCVDAGTTGKIYRCENDEWNEASLCGGNNSCKSETECGECINGDVQCSESNKTQTCTAGSWGTSRPCPVPLNGRATCDRGVCDYSCDAGYFKKNNICEQVVRCLNNVEVYDAATNTCSCNISNHWVGDAGNCVCDSGYFKNPGDSSKCCTSVDMSYGEPSCLDMLESPNVGEICIFGRYTQIASSSEQQGIRWKIMGTDDTNGMFLVSDYVLDRRPFNETSEDVTWSDSTLRSWLNGFGAESNADGIDYSENNFMNTAFTEDEKAYIHTVVNDNYAADNSTIVNTTEDKVFIIDKKQLWKYNVTKSAYGTYHLYNTGVAVNTSQCKGDTSNYLYWVGWWLRLPCSNNSVGVCHLGYSFNGLDWNGDVTASVGIRPALWLGKVDCINPGEIRDDLNNTCVCDTANNWTGDAGSCTCLSGYVRVGDICEKKKSCSNIVETYDATTNTCSCNTSNHWVGEAGSCVCEDGWFKSPDNASYCCSNANTSFDYEQCVDMENPQKGDICIFGKYQQIKGDETLYPIRWRVIETDADKGVWLQSLYALDHRAYNETLREITWEKCTLRSWLNGFGPEANLDGVDYTEESFMNSAFTKEAQDYIQTVTNLNPDNGAAPGGGDTEDRIYIANKTETGYYGLRYGTTYACNGGICSVTNCTGDTDNVYHSISWWYRMPGKNAPTKASAWSGTGTNNVGNVNTQPWGVVPTLWIKKSPVVVGD